MKEYVCEKRKKNSNNKKYIKNVILYLGKLH